MEDLLSVFLLNIFFKCKNPFCVSKGTGFSNSKICNRFVYFLLSPPIITIKVLAAWKGGYSVEERQHWRKKWIFSKYCLAVPFCSKILPHASIHYFWYSWSNWLVQSFLYSEYYIILLFFFVFIWRSMARLVNLPFVNLTITSYTESKVLLDNI